MLLGKSMLAKTESACMAIEKAAENNDGVAISRRNVVALALAGAGSLMFGAMPALAVGGGFYGQGGAFAHRGVYAGWEGPWHEWTICSPAWGFASTQKLRVALKIELGCDWCNDLYDHMYAHPYVACGDYNGNHPNEGLWFTHLGDDNYGYVHCDGKQISVFTGNLINDDRWWPTADHYGDYQDYSYVVPTWFTRREKNDRSRSYNARLDIYNYWYKGTPSSFTRDNPGQKIQSETVSLGNRRIELANRWTEFGKIARIAPAADTSFCMDAASAGPYVNGSPKLSAADGFTDQHWLVQPARIDDTDACHLHRFAPVHIPGHTKELCVENGGRPTTETVLDAIIATSGGDSAFDFWLHSAKGGDHIIGDGTGFSLDRFARGLSEDTVCDFHCEGVCQDWDNDAHRWTIDEVVFAGEMHASASPGLVYPSPSRYPSSELYPKKAGISTTAYAGDAVIAGDLRERCSVVDRACSGSVEVRYRWFSGETFEDLPEDGAMLMGRAMRESWGALPELPAHQYVGLAVEGQRLADFSLRIDGSVFPGSVCYAGLRSNGSQAQGSNGSWTSGGDRSNRLVGAKVWLEGEIAEHYEVDYRAWDGSWSDHVYSSSSADAEWAGNGGELLALQVRLIRKPRGFKAETPWKPGLPGRHFAIRDDMAGRYVACVAEMALPTADPSKVDCLTDRYRGSIVGDVLQIVEKEPEEPGEIKIEYFVDGEDSACYSESADPDKEYSVPSQAFSAGTKDGCTRFEGWFYDPGMSSPFSDGEVLSSNTKLYGRNICTVAYEIAPGSILDGFDGEVFEDEGMASPIDPQTLIPPSEEHPYGSSFTPPSRPDVWTNRDDRKRRIGFDGVFSTPSATGSPLSNITVFGDATLWLKWSILGYDGVIAGW